MDWLADIHEHARRVYSQVGQDGILGAVICCVLVVL
jgi:hypothetical protein